jgi:CII-binding regulator of phage lambda lysogenization HflD
VRDARDLAPDAFVVLIGSKCDSPYREVSREQAEEKARRLGIPYFEMSARTGEGVEDGFQTIVTEGIRRFPSFGSPSQVPASAPPKTPEPKKPAEKERKSFFSFGRKEAEPVPVLRPKVDPGQQEVNDLKLRDRLDRMEAQFLQLEGQLKSGFSECEVRKSEVQGRLMRLERSLLANPTIIAELQTRLKTVEGRCQQFEREFQTRLRYVEGRCQQFERELQSQRDRIAELGNELRRAGVGVVEVERKFVSSINSLELLTSKDINSIRIEHAHLKVLIEEHLMRSCGKTSEICELHSDDPKNGIISYLTKQCGGNVSELNLVKIRSESIAEHHCHETFEAIDPQLKYVADLESSKFFISKNSPNQWICYEFKRHSVICLNYSIHTHPKNGIKGRHHPRSWIVEGSSDGKNWIVLAEEKDNKYLDESDVWKSFPIRTQASVHQLRLRQIGRNHGGDYCLALSGFELFGRILEC